MLTAQSIFLLVSYANDYLTNYITYFKSDKNYFIIEVAFLEKPILPSLF